MKIEDMNDGDGFLAWACNISPEEEDTGHRCRRCHIKIHDFDLCRKCVKKEKEEKDAL